MTEVFVFVGVLANADAADVDATDSDAATAADVNAAISICAAEACPTFEMFISLGGIGELLSLTSGSWSTGASADGAVVVVGVVCSGSLGSFRPSTVEMSLTSVVLGALGIFLGRSCFSFLATPTPEVEDTADSGVGVGVGFGSFRGVFGPSNCPPCFRGLISSDAAATGADTVTGVVGVVVAGADFFTGVSPTVARRLDFGMAFVARTPYLPSTAQWALLSWKLSWTLWLGPLLSLRAWLCRLLSVVILFAVCVGVGVGTAFLI